MTTASADASASLFAGRYRLLRTIGEGSAATVYLARDLGDDRVVALKVFHALRLRHPLAPERLEQAACLWQRVQHPNVVALLDHGWMVLPGPSGQPVEVHYLAMEHVPGRPLWWHVHARGPFSVAEGVGIARQTLSALEAAHAVGLFHRDLRPQNVLLAPDGTVKVSDFGLSEAIGYSSPHYLSPEQAQARPAVAASDLYALGIVLYEMLVDAVPFDSTVPEVVLLKHAGEPPTPPLRLRPTLPPGLQDVVLRALEKSPEDRWPTAGEMSAALAPFADGGANSAGRAGARWSPMLAVREQDLAPTPRREWRRGIAVPSLRRLRPRAYAGLAAATLALLLVLGYALGWRVRISGPAPEPLAEQAIVQVAAPGPTVLPLPTPTLAPSTATAGTLAADPAATPAGAKSCQPPDHPNPAIAETYRAMAEDACGTPVWETVSDVLSAAVARKIEVRFGQPGASVYGVFDPGANQVVLAQSVANEAPRTRAAVLVHEFTHVRDYASGGLKWEGDVLACYDVELRAFRAEAGFWKVSQAKRGNPKPASALETDLDYIAQVIDRGSASFIARDLVGRYGSSCKVGG